MAKKDQQTSATAQGEAPVLGKYRLIAKLGQGGMADVFLAVAQGPASFKKLVVIKRHREIAGDSESIIAMFLDEAKLSARLNHPNIAQTYEIGEEDGAYFIVMEYLEGQPLNRIKKTVTRGEPGAEGFTRGAWIRIVAEALGGLHHAHELCDYDGTPLGIVHRDVSPHNIFVTYDGTVKVVDFGIAKAVINTSRTDTGNLKGKVSYMAPEQALASRSVDRRADIFTVGIVLWELLSRERLFGGDAVHALRMLTEGGEIPRLSAVASYVPSVLDNIVAKALDRDPARRFATAQEMRAALEGYLRTSGEDIRTEELGAKMLDLFGARRAIMRGQIKTYLEQAESASGERHGPRSPSLLTFNEVHGPRSAGLPLLEDGGKSSSQPHAALQSESASLKGTMVSASSSRRGYVIGALGFAALGAAAALTMYKPRQEARPSAPLVEGRGKAGCEGTLRVRITTDTTGTATDIAPPYNQGVYDYLRFLNDTQGGLRGCTIDVEMRDARYDPTHTEMAIDAWRKTPEWPQVSTLFIFGTGPTTHVASKLTLEKKLLIPGSYAGSLATPVPISADVRYPEFNSTGQSITKNVRKNSPGYPYVFFPATDYSTAIRIGIQAAWKIASGRMAMVHEAADQCLYCVDPLAAGKSYIQELPGMLLGEDLIVPQTSDLAEGPVIVKKVVDYMRKEIDKKRMSPSYVPVSWLWAGNSLVSSSYVGKGAAEAQQLINRSFPESRNQWQLRVMANNWGIGEASMKICGPACSGVLYGLFPVPIYGDTRNALGMTQMLRIHDMYREKDHEPRDKYADGRYVQGYAAALMWREAVERAIDAGHKTPTGEDLKNALETFHHVVLEGMTAGAISFSPKDHRPQANASVYKLDSSNPRSVFSFVDQYSIELDATWLGY
jgi:serine/threonine protein kinase